MLTEEQIKGLKPGDALVVSVTMQKIDDAGDIWATIPGRASSWFPPGSVSLPYDGHSKYDPCRLFKKGDKVQVISLNGRCYGKYGEYLREAYCIVLEDEEGGLGVKVRHNADDYILDPAYLELVTPVEELAPYILEEETAFADDETCGIIHIYYNYNGGRDKVRTFYENGPESWNATKEAAEAERDRLNAEYRKEQNND